MEKKKNKEVELKKLVKEQIKLKLRGITGTTLLMEKMDMDVVEKYDKKKAQKITKKDTRLEKEKVEDKIHHTKEGNIGFPAAGFKGGMIEVAPKLGLYKKDVRGAVRVLGNIIPINFKEQQVNETWGRQTGITRAPLLIIRPEFIDWSCELDIRYDASVISAEQVVNLVNYAGFHQGIGSWRPEKGGTHGEYEVVR